MKPNVSLWQNQSVFRYKMNSYLQASVSFSFFFFLFPLNINSSFLATEFLFYFSKYTKVVLDVALSYMCL